MNQVQSKMIELAGNICLYSCYKWVKLGKELTLQRLLYELVGDLENGWVKEDGTVQNANAITGKSVVKTDIDHAVGEYQCVNYRNGQHNHWVVVHNKEVVFNSLDVSQCVNKGEPDYESVRDIR